MTGKVQDANKISWLVNEVSMDQFFKNILDLSALGSGILVDPPLRFTEVAPVEESSDESNHGKVEQVEDEEESFLRTTELSWLEKYWENVKNGRRYPWMKEPLEEFPSSSWRSRVRARCEIESISFEDLVKEESIRKDRFSIHMRADHGLGIRWFIGENGRVFVNRLIPSHNGEISPAQAGQLISPGDELIRVNGRKLADMDDLGIVQLMQAIDAIAKVTALLYMFL